MSTPTDLTSSKDTVSKDDSAKLGPPESGLNRLVEEQTAKDAWVLIFGFRCIDALLVRTFFQPDEYFQSLEPAWQLVYGSQSGAWITWEWQHQLRSSLHPVLFAVAYYVVDKPMELVGFYPQFRALMLSVLPNIVQAYLAATADYYTWQFSERLYGTNSNNAWAALAMTMLSPWQWFCSTRTFSNGLETTLTVTALYFWPWKMSSDTTLGVGSHSSQYEQGVTELPHMTEPGVFQTTKSVKHLRIALLLASTACILRPTNLLIWFCVLMPTVTGLVSSKKNQVSFSDYTILLREVVLCASTVVLVSAISDRVYFEEWTFPPYQWLNFNISQDLAIFYGRNDWHYYLSQGLPLLLTTYLPFSLVALYQTTSLPSSNILFILATTILLSIATLSLISHKEVRFIYPLLPVLHIITAPAISSFFQKTITSTAIPQSQSTATSTLRRKPFLLLIISLNAVIAFYISQVHQGGVIPMLTKLRYDYESVALDSRGIPLSSPDSGAYDEYRKITNFDDTETFVGFLMPCHSTPWRSQLFYPGLKAWALTCEPPLHLAAGSPERLAYRDEADRFYDDPEKFLREEIGGKERAWPRYIVGFEGIEGALKSYYESSMGKGYEVRERYRIKNSDWHDDERRKGDVVAWEFVGGGVDKI